MIPLLTYPLALIALAALPALTAIYLLRNRYRRQTVSSLIFWRLQPRIKEGGVKRDRLQLPLVFLLELLALLVLACAATGPRWQLPITLRPLIVVLDNSVSMRAGTATDNPRLKAEQALRSLLTERRFRSVRGILAGPIPHTVSPSEGADPDLTDLLAGWTCHEPAAALDASVALAVEIGRRAADILVLTDHAPESPVQPGPGVRWWATGNPQPNVAFVNARRTPAGDDDRCLIEIACFASSARPATLSFKTGTNVLRQHSLNLDPGRTERIVLDLPARVPVLEATLPDDALAADNQALLVSPPRRKVKVQNAITNEVLTGLVDRALEATGLRIPAGNAPDLVIHQSAQNLSIASAWDLRIASDEKAVSYTGPFLTDGSHPLAQGLQLSGVIWAGPASNQLAGVPVVAVGNVALLTAREDAVGRQHLGLYLDPELSTLPTTPNWPIFFWNLLHWRLAQSPGLKECNVRLGGEVEFTTTSIEARVAGPDRELKIIPVRSRPVLYRPEFAGLHVLTTDPYTNLFAVNLLSPEESNLATAAAGRWGQWQNERETRYEYESVLWIFLILGLAILVAHLVVVARSGASI